MYKRIQLLQIDNNHKKEARPKGKHPTPPQLNVLVVDDDPVFCLVMERYGLMMNIAVTSCGSLDELEVLALPDVFDVAVIDYYLDGVQNHLKGPEVAGLLETTPTILTSRNSRCIEEAEVWPQSIKTFLSKDRGPHLILETALQLKCPHH